MTTTPAPPRPAAHSPQEFTNQQQWADEVAAARPPPPGPGVAGYAGALFVATWGSIRLFASMFHTDNSRTQVVHDLSSGDVHPVQDRGLRARRVRVTLLFDDFVGFPDQGSPLDAFREFKSAVDSGARAIFTHPVEGSYLACVGEFTYEIDEHSSITNAVAEFIAEEEIEKIEPGSNLVGALDGGAVAKAADRADVELAQVGLLGSSPALEGVAVLPPGASERLAANQRLVLGASVGASFDASAGVDFGASVSVGIGVRVNATVSAGVSATATASLSASASAAVSAEIAAGVFGGLTIDAMASVTSWSEETVTTRQITNDVARIATNIETAIEVGGFEYDLQLWRAFRALVMLGDSVRAAAIAATSDSAPVMAMRVTSPTALLPLAARVYGGADAQTRARQIAQLNDIRTPGWIEPGDYILPARSPAQRAPF